MIERIRTMKQRALGDSARRAGEVAAAVAGVVSVKNDLVVK
jgi:hypothetical protein